MEEFKVILESLKENKGKLSIIYEDNIFSDQELEWIQSAISDIENAIDNIGLF